MKNEIQQPPVIQSSTPPPLPKGQSFWKVDKWVKTIMAAWSAFCAYGFLTGIFGVLTENKLSDNWKAFGLFMAICMWGFLWGVIVVPLAVVWKALTK